MYGGKRERTGPVSVDVTDVGLLEQTVELRGATQSRSVRERSCMGMCLTVSWSSCEGLMGPFLGREPIFSTATLNWASMLESAESVRLSVGRKAWTELRTYDIV